ncbi:unnamed protein product [Hydatigera taeniaeformis]|uniref:Uncharacterized protein n=1 Tax=Hydatigena taeniaeformis TaxID=6205 RepID=A0A0R3X9Z4_HYDTA|nr:unnamed protein product [Hydatigera taeniaeformis]
MEELPRLLCTAQHAPHLQSHRAAVRSPDDFVVSCCRSLPLRYLLSVHIASIVRFGQSLEEWYPFDYQFVIQESFQEQEAELQHNATNSTQKY